MSSKALEIVEEFLRSNDTQTLRNAVVALRTLGTQDSIKLLISLSLDAEPPGLRRAAAKEVVRLAGDPKQRPAVLNTLHSALSNPNQAPAAYHLLSRMYRAGIAAPPPAGSLRQRLAMAGYLYPRPPERERLAMLAQAGFRGGVVGLVAAAMPLVILRHFPPLIQGMLLAALAVVAAVALALAAGGRAVPMGAYPDQRVGLLREVLGAAVRALLPSLAVALMAFVLAAVAEEDPSLLTLAVAAVLGFGGMVAVCGTARLGAALGRSAGPERWATTVANLAGGGFPIVLITTGTLLSLLLGQGGGAQPLQDAAALYWLLLLPVCCGVGHAFASVETRMPAPATGYRGRWARMVVLAPAALILAATLAGFAARPEADGLRPVVVRPGVDSLTVDSLPATRRIEVKPEGRGSVLLVVRAADQTSRSTGILVRVPGARRSEHGQGVLDAVLWPGSYELRVSDEDAPPPRPGPLVPRQALLRLVSPRAYRRVLEDGSMGERRPGGVKIWVQMLDAAGYQKRREASRLADSAATLVSQGRTRDGIHAMRRLVPIDPAVAAPASPVLSSGLYSYLCWEGNMENLSNEVMPFCEQAVRQEPDNMTAVHSRGIARALTGNPLGAIRDLEHVGRDSVSDGFYLLRSEFIEALRSTGHLPPDAVQRLKLLAAEEGS